VRNPRTLAELDEIHRDIPAARAVVHERMARLMANTPTQLKAMLADAEAREKFRGREALLPDLPPEDMLARREEQLKARRLCMLLHAALDLKRRGGTLA
jgi:hypothetical protein